MRLRITIVFILLSVVNSAAVSQSCLPEGITFTTQAQVDSFETNYPNCTIIEGYVFITGFDGITNLEGLSALTSIEGYLHIGGNWELNNLNGLEGLTSIGGGLEIGYNSALISLTGLGNVSSIGGGLWIEMNNTLTSLSGLDNIESNSIANLTIFMNDNLSTCEVKSICDYLSTPNGSVWIIDNAVGCEDKQQVLDRCVTIGMQESDLNTQLVTYPNPFTAYTTIEYEVYTRSNIQYTVYNRVGEAVVVGEERNVMPGNHTITLSLHHLPAGLYFAVLRSGEGVSVVKLIKQ